MQVSVTRERHFPLFQISFPTPDFFLHNYALPMLREDRLRRGISATDVAFVHASSTCVSNSLHGARLGVVISVRIYGRDRDRSRHRGVRSFPVNDVWRVWVHGALGFEFHGRCCKTVATKPVNDAEPRLWRACHVLTFKRFERNKQFCRR